MKTKLACLLVVAVLLTGCAAHQLSGENSNTYGFWSGFLHGWIAPFAMIGMLFSWMVGPVGISFFDSVQLIGVPNTGTGYEVGFVLGLLSYARAKH